MKKRSLAILAGGMSLALLLSSCGPSSAPTESPSSAPADETGQQTAEEPVTITYCNFNASGGNEETLQKMYEAFHEEHPAPHGRPGICGQSSVLNRPAQNIPGRWPPGAF